MTSRERLRRCYWHEETDRPAAYLYWHGMEENTDPTYRDLKRLIVEKTDRKIIWTASHLIQPPPMETAEEPYDDQFRRVVRTLHTPKGSLVEMSLVGLHGRPGLTKEHFLRGDADAEAYLSLPMPAIGGDCSPFFSFLKEIGERGIVEVYPGFNPAGTVVELFGSETFAFMTIEHRGLVHRLMERECEVKKRLIKYLVDSGAGPYFCFGGEEYLVPPLHGRRDFFDFNVRYDRPIMDLIHDAGGRVHIHSHGSVKAVLDGFIEAGADVLHPFEAPPMGNVTPREAKEALRGRVTLEGNIQIADLYEKDPGNIREQVSALIRDCFDDRRGLIVSPTASPYLVGEGQRCLPNYRAIVEEVLGSRC